MRRSNSFALLSVASALLAAPLSCGDDESSIGDDGAGGSGANATGGSGGEAGVAAGGSGAASGGNATTGGTSGAGATSGGATGGRGGGATGGRGGGATGGASGAPGESGASGSPSGGTSGDGAGPGGEGGEGWYDESIERAKRICKKAEPLGCDDHSRCVEDFRWGFFAYPYCDRVSDRVLTCLDTRATIEDFACWVGRPAVNVLHCADELYEADELGCVG